MNTWLSWRFDARFVPALRAALRRGTRVSHHLFSVVGALAVTVALALWLLPAVRGTLAARLMPMLTAAIEAGPARLLSGHPLPAFGPARPAQADEPARAGDAGLEAVRNDGAFDGAFDGSGASGLVPPASPALLLDARTSVMPEFVAKMISSQPVSADARDDRVLVSAREQALVTSYLSRRYHVAQEPVAQLVKAAFETGRQVGLDPLLLLAVMAIESGFNPYAESGVGARGLMQVMAKVHSDKFQYFGGQTAALQPLANITVGALVLKDCIARGGSLAEGLRFYVGSTSPDDGGYGAKVMAERGRLRDVARGRSVPINAPQAPQGRPVVASTKRVQVAMTSGHGTLVTKAAAPAASASGNDENNGASAAHGGGAELGA
ncbi:transglycosylase SLT domain-containing protein [Trinickia caryophylli]|uniref:Transglycosylase SLT domain-containing protein n=1 Tax=Trinickia caryophylli TaxID=28094 RepID=A0A1X7CJA9_TRICW|nr:transglycosylase SLT domain-containing protein [Trinickia caryophylli]PMS09089.1 transglycosylase SLT domain protein [Trinickia caryophylli]TRX19965.1 lytic transglycosylase domain-containing protein [Trinickia caryophylli]WQE12696.1 transglycosylase SLT domain-containing protein [Trinickia caryophylli]SME97717.1 Transglycosylase SLT domain-containing protein [Trinickia caryophylli]GLU30402.1 transglycosylase [Trinickia caryophylli]